MSPLLTASSVSFAYGQKTVLRDLSLTLDPGEIVAFLGPNGSGKSTLIKTLIGHLHARHGTIHWQDRPLPNWHRRDLARLVAYLPQNPAWEPQQTVFDALRIGRAPYWKAFGIESPRDIQVVHDVASLLQLDDLLDRPVDELSGGQRQRVFIGRCLVQEPKAMLLDEPNTYLDLRHQVEIGQLLVRLTREKSIGILMTSHDLNLASIFADRLMLLDDGHIVAAGAANTVLDPDLLSHVYGLPMRRVEAPPGKPLVVPDVQ
jgi:iron complex transport system ATP-binding protein